MLRHLFQFVIFKVCGKGKIEQENSDKTENSDKIDNSDKTRNSEKADNNDKTKSCDKIDNNDKTGNSETENYVHKKFGKKRNRSKD